VTWFSLGSQIDAEKGNSEVTIQQSANHHLRFYWSDWLAATGIIACASIGSLGKFQFNLAGDPSLSLRISASRNLVDWATHETFPRERVQAVFGPGRDKLQPPVLSGHFAVSVPRAPLTS